MYLNKGIPVLMPADSDEKFVNSNSTKWPALGRLLFHSESYGVTNIAFTSGVSCICFKMRKGTKYE
jgi:hypothetical protein